MDPTDTDKAKSASPPRVVINNTSIDKTVHSPNVHVQKTSQQYPNAAQYKHLFKQNKEHLLGRLCPNKSRLNRVLRQAQKPEIVLQAQSIQELSTYA